MIRSISTIINAEWYASDLEERGGCSKLELLSVHRHIANFKVAGWRHLLMVADPAIEKGPAVIGLSSDDFRLFTQKIVNLNELWFKTERALCLEGKSGVILNMTRGEALSFTPIKYTNLDKTNIDKTVAFYKAMLKGTKPDHASLVLLNLPGGEDYFRDQIEAVFPGLVASLFDCQEQEFISSCRNLIGMGRGLTPTGDDLICGALTGFHYFTDKDIFIKDITESFHEASLKTGLMGRHMLEIGRRGLTPGVISSFICSIAEGKPDATVFKRILKIGSSTGVDIICAILYLAGKLTLNEQTI